MGDRHRKRRRLTELTEHSKKRERTKDSQGKHKEEEILRSMEFYNSIFIISHKSSYVLYAKQRSPMTSFNPHNHAGSISYYLQNHSMGGCEGKPNCNGLRSD